ncbi:MAG: YlxR family protein [Chloroflexi bacterium]|nr:YlxR family protein [Chloroflexota bacterium]MBI3339025.1 YlxR family protein [Chloroflexota bacterium]
MNKVSTKTVQRSKHVPQRTCVGCRTVMAKRQLVRVVRTAGGVLVDRTGKLAGRGAYLHDRRSCWESGLKGSLANALKVVLTPADRLHLETFMNTLSEADPGE